MKNIIWFFLLCPFVLFSQIKVTSTGSVDIPSGQSYKVNGVAIGGGISNPFAQNFAISDIELSAAVGGTAYAIEWICPFDFTATKLFCYYTNSGNEVVTLGLYSFDGNTLIGSGTISANPGTGRQSTGTISTMTLVGGTRYYLAIIATNTGGTSNHGYKVGYGDGVLCKSKYIGDTGLPANLTGFTTDTKMYWIGVSN